MNGRVDISPFQREALPKAESKAGISDIEVHPGAAFPNKVRNDGFLPLKRQRVFAHAKTRVVPRSFLRPYGNNAMGTFYFPPVKKSFLLDQYTERNYTMKEQLNSIKEIALKELENVSAVTDLEALKVKFLGKKAN